MRDAEETKKIVALIDADNTQLAKLKAILDEISTHGRIVVKNAYGDWKNTTLKNWEAELKRLAVKPVQQFAYVTGKNATDIAMVIDSMDLLHTELYDMFVLVSSDSDFTPLAIRLRESGVYVFGVGEEKTPQSFKNACDNFIFIEYLSKAEAKVQPDARAQPEAKIQPEAAKRAAVTAAENAALEMTDIDEIHELLKIAYEKYQDEEGLANISSAGIYIKRAKPDFNPRIYGFAKLPDLLKHFPEKYEMKRMKGKGTAMIIVYRCR